MPVSSLGGQTEIANCAMAQFFSRGKVSFFPPTTFSRFQDNATNIYK